jgi:NADPH-dependent curcumin reductase CurA
MCDLEAGKARVKELLESDYVQWNGKARRVMGLEPERSDRYEIDFKDGRNYIKVIRLEGGVSRSVVGFIVKKETKGFKVGDILKAASWSAPALNFARGHVDDEELKLNWAGI